MDKKPHMNYFGYGAMRHGDVINAVIGRIPVGEHVQLRGMKLCIQRIDQLPAAIQTILRRAWPDTFKSYTIVPDPNGVVNGMLWWVREQELALIRNWELVDLGWYDQIEVGVSSSQHIVPAFTEVMKGDQPFDYEVDGENYDTLLNPLKDTVAIATRVRQEFLAAA